MKDKKLYYKVLTILSWIVLIGCVAFLLMHQFGKEKLNENIAVNLTGISTEVTEDTYKTINYEGQEYTYKDNLINILCIGVDKTEMMSERDVDTNSIGQGDVIVLMSMDLDSKEISMIPIPRDTMVMLEMYNSKGGYLGQREGQITLQYAYGDGEALSAGLTAQQVSSILSGIPINAYAAINIYSLWNLNDAVGGVDITMDEDYTMYNPLFEKGATVHLEGNALENYLRGRVKSESGSAYTRMHRIKQYMLAFFEQAKVKLKDDPTLPIRAMNVLEEHMATDVSVDEALYLVTEAMNCTFSEENIYTLPGEIIRAENYEQFYLDTDEVAKLVIDLFYEPVE